jgi:hypothetical protein
MAVEFLGKNAPDGVTLGLSATEKVSFFGATPVIQQAITAVATVTATTTINEGRIGRIETALVNLGLITTGG